MIGPIQNAMRLQALRAGGHKITSRYAIVTGYDPNKYSAKVSIQPEVVKSGFLPIATPWAGNGWGMFSPPAVGAQVVVVFVDGDFTAGFVLAQFFNSATQPLPVPSGELWVVHAKGGFFKLTNDGKVTFADGQGAQIQFDGSGNIISAANNWTHTGIVTFESDVNFQQDVTVNQSLTANIDVVGDGVSLKGHLTSGVTSGTGTSGPPIP